MTTPHPYHAITVNLHDADGHYTNRVRLVDDASGAFEIIDMDRDGGEGPALILDVDAIPALVRALRIIQRENRRVEREGS